ncbi:hypothetical protein HMPREF0724_12358 [Prescottella equi ATCC 33707]|uniref:Uncharacterized protein n=1 Tax=Prescottella equi ATCC 33707 TaxID=525370 RepID=E9T149_RHOHA|nr:hypothetical protein HMPREF0724_12358 [Prescottella equi ATCC 33707]
MHFSNPGLSSASISTDTTRISGMIADTADRVRGCDSGLSVTGADRAVGAYRRVVRIIAQQ